MHNNPFLNFQRAAEAAGYPALLIVSMVCLGLVVAAVALLALIPAVWVLALALLSLIAAVAVLTGAITASFSDYGEPDRRRDHVDVGARAERAPVEPLPRRPSTTRQAEQQRRAA